MRDNYEKLLQSTQVGFRQFAASTLSIRPPSSEEKRGPLVLKLERSFEKAKTAMLYLKGEYEGLGDGICAGLPRFPNYWARDTGWSLRGYLSIGDYHFARAVIDNFLNHQAQKDSKGAVVGELPMIISGKAFLHTTTYGSADSTFLFPWAIREYVLSTGDIKYLRKRWDSIVRLVDCGLLKDIDGDGLVDHGFTGTAEKLPIQDSTWMDHIDRRKSANDVQALFFESLMVGSELAGMVDDRYNKTKWSRKAQELKSRIDRKYWNNKEGFYYDTIRKDGSKDPSIRPNSLVLLLTDAVKSKSKADTVLDRIEGEDMTTSWGLRTLSTRDPKYDPGLYHNGAVWPLVTAWAALSEIKFRRTKQAFYYINLMAERILTENGMFAETYRGDRPEPFNSCILQAWSVGLFVHALHEMMLGMKVNMIENRIRFEPQIDEESLNISQAPPMVFEHMINATNSRKGRFQVAVDSYHKKISVILKHWQGPRPEFVCDSSYDISVS
jgi:glycogen debranching enzyme